MARRTEPPKHGINRVHVSRTCTDQDKVRPKASCSRKEHIIKDSHEALVRVADGQRNIDVVATAFVLAYFFRGARIRVEPLCKQMP